ncbi:hypothetical protein [Streptomyces sp. N35]|uniref:hypothetical protein n=1 Tax=Streptomyces sp. N35 TaxID=2795730 RepID=UPI0018F6353F|nr:hypothetical protein [Streptomyces sp. N35]
MLFVAAFVFLLVVLAVLGAIGALCAGIARVSGASVGWTIAVGLLSAPLTLGLFFLIMST